MFVFLLNEAQIGSKKKIYENKKIRSANLRFSVVKQAMHLS